MILDCHTHSNKAEAIINARLSDFKPEIGRLYSVGLHPWDIDENKAETVLKTVLGISSGCDQVVAIGETGLDSLIDTPLSIQTNLLRKHIELSETLNKPLILHCVRCSNDIITLHREYTPHMAWIMHGFRSNYNVLKQLLNESDIYISIGEKFNEEAVKLIPDNRLLVETDESNLTIDEIIEKIAATRNQTPLHIKNIVSQNVNRCL